MARPHDARGREVARRNLPARLEGAVERLGRCPCGLPARERCSAGCGRDVCGEHLLHRSSRLAWPGPYRSEREHTAYLRGFWANGQPLCAWCRELAGTAAVSTLPPVPPLAGDVVARLATLLHHPHDYPPEAWTDTVRQHGGPARVAAVLAPRLLSRHRAQVFEGRRRGQLLSGVALGLPRRDAACDVVDRAGTVWSVRFLPPGLSRRRAWAWEPAPADRVTALLPTMVDRATSGGVPR